jgi:hypothetical protein
MDEVRHIILNEREVRVREQMLDVSRRTGEKIIKDDHAMSFQRAAVHERWELEESGAAGDDGDVHDLVPSVTTTAVRPMLK